MDSYFVASFYLFKNICPDVLDRSACELRAQGELLGLVGLVILAEEGINATIAGKKESVLAYQEFLQSRFASASIDFKNSSSIKRPFRRLVVKVRPEIVTTNRHVLPTKTTDHSHLSAREWHHLAKSDPKLVILDVRNRYEIGIGKFEGATDLGIDNFSEFPDALTKSAIPKQAQILTYCTGGIRCEKAVTMLKDAGYQNVFQLSGGILRYLETIPEGFFEGECFVFDYRVALDKNLQPSERYKLCPHCGEPASTIVQCEMCNQESRICEPCISAELRTCSCDCQNRLQQRAKRMQSAAAAGARASVN